ncbi:MAG: polysulfide reductase NrfD [Nitrospira sp.]|nr:polysulfide reductase NrfD [bacterium]MBL7050309.1 polysulfide reductase NrfD [Nitrospira sp.]
MKAIETSVNYVKQCMHGTSKNYYRYCAALLIIAVIGLSNSISFLVHGHVSSGMSDFVPWGIYISALAFFIGCSAGATMVGLLIHGFGREDYHPIGTRAIILALLSIFAATQCVMMDVGNPFRAMKIPFLLRNVTSMFFISSSSYMGFMAILMGELVSTVMVTRGGASDRVKKIAKVLGIIAVPYALIVVHSFTGTIFGVVKAREMWNTPLLPIHFVTSALASGFALVILVTVLTSWVRKKHLVSLETYNNMGVLFCFFLIATVFLDIFDYVILIYSSTAEGIETWHLLTTRYLILFAMNIGGLIIATIITAFKKGRTPMGLFIATTITILAIAAYRLNLLSVGQMIPLYPEIGEIQYIPTLPEVMPFFGLVALLMLIYSILTKLLPMEENAHTTGSEGE